MRLMPEKTAVLLSFALASLGCGGNQSESSHWAGKTYLLDVPTKHWNQPSNKNVAQAVGEFVPQFLISVSGAGSSETALVATANSDGSQSLCDSTHSVSLSESKFPDSAFTIPEFSIRLTRTDSDSGKSATVRATIRNLAFTNLLPNADDTPRTDGSFSAIGDMADLAPLFFMQDNPTGDSICTMLASDQYVTPCATCAFNNETHCLTVGAVQLGAQVTTTSVKQVSVNDSDSSCL